MSSSTLISIVVPSPADALRAWRANQQALTDWHRENGNGAAEVLHRLGVPSINMRHAEALTLMIHTPPRIT